MANALGTLFGDIAAAIREKTGDTSTMKPAEFPSKISSISAGGGSSADVRYVTFMSDDGVVEYGKLPVATGYDCPDPKFAVKKESTVQYDYDLLGWATTANGALNANALKVVTEDRTVYANFAAILRYYTITYLDTDGSVLKAESLAYGSMPSYVPAKQGFLFIGWDKELSAVNGDTNYTAAWKVAGFEVSTWAEIAAISASGKASESFALGDTKTISIGGTQVELEIAGFNHDNLTDGSGKAGISIIAKTLLANDIALYDSSHPSSGNWENSAIHQWMVNDLMDLLPSDLKAVIKPVNKISPTTATGGVTTLSEKVWAPSLDEMIEIPTLIDGSSASSVITTGLGTKYAWYTDSGKRIRYKPDGTAYLGNTRTRYKQMASLHCTINKTGGAAYNTSGVKGVIIGFCI